MKAAAGEILQTTEVLVAYAYGSRVDGAARADSDLDIGYFLAARRARPPLPLRGELLVASRLSDRLHCDVDLRNLDEAPTEVQGRVIEQGVCLYCADQVARAELENAILSTYRDAKQSIREVHQRHIHEYATEGL